MTDTPTRFPLAWPAGRPRTQYPKSGSYKSDGKPITTSVAMDRLDGEVHRLGGTNLLLSTNVDVTLAGRPRSGAAQPADPGVCLYFTLKGKPFAMACDSFDRVEQNIAALAAHIEATRRIDRLGVATAAETLQAFAALPAPDHALPGRKPWRQVLGFSDSFPNGVFDPASDVRRRWKARQIEAATDAERSDLNVARDAALKELSDG